MEIFDCIVVGNDVSSLISALFLARKMRRVLVFHDKTTSQIKELGYIETEVSNLLSVVEQVVQAYSPQMRAHLLMELFGKNDAESQEIVNAIKLYGFDVHYNNKQELSPLHLAIKNNDINLFNLVLSQDATILEEYSLIS